MKLFGLQAACDWFVVYVPDFIKAAFRATARPRRKNRYGFAHIAFVKHALVYTNPNHEANRKRRFKVRIVVDGHPRPKSGSSIFLTSADSMLIFSGASG